MKTLPELLAHLAHLEAEIVKAKAAEKALQKLSNCRLNNRTAAKYFDLQRAYMDSLKG